MKPLPPMTNRRVRGMAVTFRPRCSRHLCKGACAGGRAPLTDSTESTASVKADVPFSALDVCWRCAGCRRCIVCWRGGAAIHTPDEVGKCYYDWARRLHHRGEEVYIVEVVVCGEGGGGSCGSRRPVSRSTRKSLMNRGGNHVSSERVRDLLLKQWPLIVVCIL